MLRHLCLSAFLFAIPAKTQEPQVPRWIWSTKDTDTAKRVTLRRTFELTAVPESAVLTIGADDGALVYVNGEQVASIDNWRRASVIDLREDLVVGTNLIAVEARNDDGKAGVVARLVLQPKDGAATTIVSDPTWRAGKSVRDADRPGFDDSKWSAAVVLGELGVEPWGDIFANAKLPGANAHALAPSEITVPKGFVVELVHDVPRGRQGSWVSLASDPKGRLYASDQGGSLFRIVPCAPGARPETTKVTRLRLPLGCAHGLLWAYDSLYVTVNGRYADNGSGLYRARDVDGDGELDTVEKLRAIDGVGEHGPHGLALGPDGMIYVVAGNFTKLPEPIDVSLPPRIWQEDILLPRMWDPKGHAKDLLAPGGWIARTDAQGKRWELVSIGYRNAYDLVFGPDGELFSWDSDMEWDMGTPWYRPTRITHSPPAADFGWRSGSGNTPSWFVDELPPVLDVGPGSPVGVVFGTNAKFPTRYRKALFALDWTFGTIWAVHLEAKGASYVAKKEEFAFGKPWPLTDVVIGTDGAMYLTIGGRGTQSGLYRVRYTGSEATAAPEATPPTPECLLRRELETRIGAIDDAALAFAWQHLGHEDRFVRFAARAVVEHVPVARWQEKVFTASEARARITALVALARCGDPALQARALAAWLALDLTKLGSDDRLAALRACSLLITRMGHPDRTTALQLAAKVDVLFPSPDLRLNRDLASLLAVLGSPTIVPKLLLQMRQEETLPRDPELDRLITRNGGFGGGIAKMVASKPVSQHLHYANALSVLEDGWTKDTRREYFTWLANAPRTSTGGDSFQGFVNAIREAAAEHVPEEELEELAPDKLLTKDAAPPPPVVWVEPKGPPREWTLEAAVPLTQKGLVRRDFSNGRAMYQAVQCTICHRFGGDGASVGPDLTTVGSKFNPRDLLESILEPSKVISDQYQRSVVKTKDGAEVFGKLLSDKDGELVLATNPFDAKAVTRIPKATVVSVKPLDVSTMPPGLVNRLNENELLDLVAYLLSGGNPEDKMFAK